MSNMTKVTQVMAAEMVGKSRITINRHIKDGTLSKDADGKIDVSELRRVYGDDILTPEQVEEKKKGKSADKEEGTVPEAELLRKQYEILVQERQRERELLNEQIDLLKERLEKSEEREKSFTLLLTHQSKESAEEKQRKQEQMDKDIKALQDTLQRLERQNEEQASAGFFKRFFGARRA